MVRDRKGDEESSGKPSTASVRLSNRPVKVKTTDLSSVFTRPFLRSLRVDRTTDSETWDCLPREDVFYFPVVSRKRYGFKGGLCSYELQYCAHLVPKKVRSPLGILNRLRLRSKEVF